MALVASSGLRVSSLYNMFASHMLEYGLSVLLQLNSMTMKKCLYGSWDFCHHMPVVIVILAWLFPEVPITAVLSSQSLVFPNMSNILFVQVCLRITFQILKRSIDIVCWYSFLITIDCFMIDVVLQVIVLKLIKIQYHGRVKSDHLMLLLVLGLSNVLDFVIVNVIGVLIVI